MIVVVVVVGIVVATYIAVVVAARLDQTEFEPVDLIVVDVWEIETELLMCLLAVAEEIDGTYLMHIAVEFALLVVVLFVFVVIDLKIAVDMDCKIVDGAVV